MICNKGDAENGTTESLPREIQGKKEERMQDARWVMVGCLSTSWSSE